MKYLIILFFAVVTHLFADGLPGVVSWSDGKTARGDLELSPGKELQMFTDKGQTVVSLEAIQEIRFIPENEQMFEGFYFPQPGQPLQKKTGEVYPIRNLKAEILLKNGQTLSGHIITTVLYLTDDDGTQKIILEAKQKGENGTKLSDLIYASTIQFTGPFVSNVDCEIDLSKSLKGIKTVTCYAKTNLAPVLLTPLSGKANCWTVPLAPFVGGQSDSNRLFLCVEAADGFHLSWPAKDDPAASAVIQEYLKLMQDFYDTRTLLGCFTEPDTGDTFSVVMMSRVAASVDPSTPHPYSLVLLRWKYDAQAKKATLLNRIPIVVERLQGNSSLPVVFKEPDLFHYMGG